MSILSAIKQESNSLDDLAKLPQTLIMQMAQNGQISKEMVAPILGKKAEMADATARMRAMQQGGQQQSVMEQIMQKNAQGENPIPQLPTNMQETGVAQIPTREPQYAGGGIIAFDGGGMAMSMDDDETENYNEAVADEEHKGMMSKLYSMLGKMPKSFVSSKADADMKSAGIGSLAAPERSGHPYEAEAIAAAKKVGLDPSIMLHALYKETGGLKDPATAMSKAGAYGPMQLMAGTAKDLGVNRKDPYENILGGATYLKQQLDTFKEPRLALAAYNAGPGAVRRALAGSQGIAALSRETQGYMKYAEGGMIPGYAAGEYIDPASTLSPGEEIIDTPEKLDYFKEWMRRNAAAREDIKKGAAEDRGLAILQAGLGMLGGTSPYAMANIGAGAMQGVQSYGAAKRARTQEQMLLDKMEIGALGAKNKQEGLEEYRQARLEEQAANRNRLEENRLARLEEQAANRTRLTAQASEANEQKALRNAALDPDYKKFSSALENMTDQTDPMYDYYTSEMRKIQQAYLSGKPYVRGNPPVKIKDPSIFDRIKSGFSSLPVGGSSGVDAKNPLLAK
jgi:hypothetical protein